MGDLALKRSLHRSHRTICENGCFDASQLLRVSQGGCETVSRLDQ
jgi:hypothetical protein